MLEVVTLKEIDAIFVVTDALGIHREMLVIRWAPRRLAGCAGSRAASSRSSWTPRVRSKNG